MSERHPVSFWAGLAAVLVVAGANLVRPGRWLLGSAGAEVYGHAWVQWWVSLDWPGLPAETRWVDPPRVTAWPVIDPVPTWLAAGLGKVLGLVWAYDLLLLGGVALAFVGGWALAKRIGGVPLIGALGLSLAPVFGGSLASGLTEDAGYGVVALALVWVGRAGWRSALLAGALLGLTSWLGLYLAVVAAVAAVVVGVAVLLEDRRRVVELCLAAALATALTVPAAMRQGERLAGQGHHTGQLRADMPEPHWRVSPWRQADLAAFVTPGPDLDDGALIRIHPVYLGWVMLALAALGACGARRWWVLVVLGLALAPGTPLRWAGQPTGIPNPVVVGLGQLPLGELVNHWGRLWLLGQLGLAMAAAVGARRLEDRRWAWMLPWLVAGEYLLLAPGPWPLPVADASVPAVYRQLDALPAGAVVVMPSAGPGVPFQRPLYRQRGHQRPLMVHPNQPGYGRAAQVPLVRWLAALPGERREPPAPDVERSLRELAAMDVGVLVVEPPYVDAVVELLGPPDVQAEGGAAWAVR